MNTEQDTTEICVCLQEKQTFSSPASSDHLPHEPCTLFPDFTVKSLAVSRFPAHSQLRFEDKHKSTQQSKHPLNPQFPPFSEGGATRGTRSGPGIQQRAELGGNHKAGKGSGPSSTSSQAHKGIRELEIGCSGKKPGLEGRVGVRGWSFRYPGINPDTMT